MSISKNAITFLHANLFLILPVLLIILLLFLSLLLQSPLTDFLKLHNSSCDYRFGGGSVNLCEDGSSFNAFCVMLILATIESFFLSRYILKASHIKSKSPIYGIGLFYGIPMVLLLIHWNVTNGIYGNARGTITDWIIFISIPLIIAGLLFFSIKNYQSYVKKNTPHK